MKKILIGLLMGIMVFSLACSSPATTNDDPVATVNGEAISRADFNRNLALVKYNIMLRQGQNYFDDISDEAMDPILNQLLQDMIDEHLVVTEANKAEIGPTDEYMDDYFKRYMEANFGTAETPSEGGKAIRAYLDENDINDDFLFKMLKNDQTIREYIFSIQNEFSEDETKKAELLESAIAQVRAAHILVPLDKKDLVDELYEKLSADSSLFEELAKEHSIDGSATNGGDLGYFVRTEMLPEFNDAAFAAQVGQVTEPVETQFGYHLIMVSDQRTLEQMEEAGEEAAMVEMAERGIMEDSIRQEYYRRINDWKSAAEIKTFDLK